VSAKHALLDAGSCGIVHLAHFGIIYSAGRVEHSPAAGGDVARRHVPQPARALCLPGAGRPILGAILARAGFNLAMNAVIFYGLGLF
jgi:hypothetical protein